ncbi:MAG: Fe-S cluster assembly scaffold IscU, partial [Alcaligenaceae bacterium]|nr:Fe-S cluster assembly scaffold IscU [Alcaligenaceae bacterium]
MVYSELLTDHFERPRHAGRLDSDAGNVGTGIAGTRETGGVLRMQISVTDSFITDTRFQAYGPPALIAAGSWLAEKLVGASLEQAQALTHQPIAEALALPTARLHFALLAEDAIRAAIQDYKDKQK